MPTQQSTGMGFFRLTKDGALWQIPGEPQAAAVDQGYDEETLTWISRIDTAGGGYESNSKAIADALIRAIKATLYNDKIIYLLPLLGNGITSAAMPLRDRLAVGKAMTSSFNDPDFNQSRGLQGDGAIKYMDSLVRANLLGTNSNGGFGWWENNIVLTGNVEPMGFYGASLAQDRFVLDLRSSLRGFRWGLPANGASDASAATNGHYYGQRSDPSVRSVYLNGTLLNTNTTADAANEISEANILLMGSNEQTFGIKPWPGRCACVYMTSGDMTISEINDFNTILRTYLIDATGRPH